MCRADQPSPPLVADVPLSRLKQTHGFASSGTAPASARDAAVGPSHLPFRAARVARVRDGGAVAQGREVRQTEIDADALRRWRKRPRIHLTGETREPLTRLALDRQRLDPALYQTMELDLEGPDPGDVQVSAVHAKAELGVRERIEPARRPEAREARMVPSTDPGKEAAEGVIDAVQHVLQHLRGHARHVWPLDLDRRQLRRLLLEADRDARPASGIAPLLHGRVAEFTAQPQVSVAPGALRGRGIQLELPRPSLSDGRRPHDGTVPDRGDPRGHRASDSVRVHRDAVQWSANCCGDWKSAGPNAAWSDLVARCRSR